MHSTWVRQQLCILSMAWLAHAKLKGVRQGCLLSTLLFNIYAEAMMKEATEEMEEGVKIVGHLIQAVRSADDQTMVESTAGLQVMNKLNVVAQCYGMKINKNETKVMKIRK